MGNSSLRVLYVEDDEVDAQLLLIALERYDPASQLDLDVVPTISEAKEKITSETYDAFILDWNLPDGFGPDFAEHLRQSMAQNPILFVSGRFTPDRVKQAELYSPSACLEKDYSKERVSHIGRLLRDMLKDSANPMGS